MEPADATPDLVGRTSARLLADGVGRADRLDALHLLAVLDASTDATGRVRRPLDDLAAEFELPPMGVIRSLDHLERAGAIQRDGGAVILLDRDEGGVGGLRLADFLDDVGASFDGFPAPEGSRWSPWLARTGAALVAAAAVVGVLALAPSQPVGQPVATAPTTSASPPTTIIRPAPTSLAPLPSVADPSSVDSAPATNPFAGPVDSTVVAVATCPTNEPVATVIGTVIRITNPTTADVVVTVLDIGGVPTATLITIPAGQAVDNVLPTAPPSASIDEWSWSDPTIARSCAS